MSKKASKKSTKNMQKLFIRLTRSIKRFTYFSDPKSLAGSLKNQFKSFYERVQKCKLHKSFYSMVSPIAKKGKVYYNHKIHFQVQY